MTAPEPPSLIVETLVENHRQFRTFLAQRVGDPSDADDILQAAYLKGIEKEGTLHDPENVLAWFYRLLRNALVDYYRSRDAERRTRELVEHTAVQRHDPDPEVERAVCQCVLRLLPTINEDYADLLRRIDIEGERVHSVATASGVSANSVRVKLHRARRSLRKQLALSCGTCAEHGCLDCSCQHGPSC